MIEMSPCYLFRHISLKGKVICEAGLVEITPVHPHYALLHGEQEGALSLPDEVTEVIKAVKGLKSDYYIFNSSGELQQEVAEHSIGEGGSSCGTALWPSSTLWRYAVLFWLFCAACCSRYLLLVSAIFICVPPHCYFSSLCPLFCFSACLPLFAAHFHHISPTASPYRSKINFFFVFLHIQLMLS